MSPWDEIKYFEPTTQTFPILTSGSVFTIGADPRRVLLIFAANSSAALYLSKNKTVTIGAIPPGVPLTNGTKPFFLSHELNGGMVHEEWFLLNPQTFTISITLYSLTMKEWPSGLSEQELLRRLGSGQGPASLSGSAPLNLPSGIRSPVIPGRPFGPGKMRGP